MDIPRSQVRVFVSYGSSQYSIPRKQVIQELQKLGVFIVKNILQANLVIIPDDGQPTQRRVHHLHISEFVKQWETWPDSVYPPQDVPVVTKWPQLENELKLEANESIDSVRSMSTISPEIPLPQEIRVPLILTNIQFVSECIYLFFEMDMSTMISDLMAYILQILDQLDTVIALYINVDNTASVDMDESYLIWQTWLQSINHPTQPTNVKLENLHATLNTISEHFHTVYEDWATRFRFQMQHGSCSDLLPNHECALGCYVSGNECRSKPIITIMLDIVRAFCTSAAQSERETNEEEQEWFISNVFQPLNNICVIWFKRSFDPDCVNLLQMVRLIQNTLSAHMNQSVLWSQSRGALNISDNMYRLLFIDASFEEKEQIFEQLRKHFDPEYEPLFLNTLSIVKNLLQHLKE